MISLISVLYLLSFHTASTLAGQCLSLCRDPDDCPPAAPEPDETPPIWQTCPSGPADGTKWACQADDIDFPTVDCLVADMRTCGLIGQGGRPTVFYSFGATTVQARTQFRDTLTPKGVMFNDAIDENYWNTVLNVQKFHMDIQARMTVLVARYAEAMATVSTGEVFFVVKNFNGDGGGQGAYQMPLPGNPGPNVWRAYEFPTLQRNSGVTRVTSVDLSNGLARSVDWQPNQGLEELPASGASGLVVPPLPPGCAAVARLRRRADPPCADCITYLPPGSPTGTVSVPGVASATAVTSPAITPAPTISCSIQHEDPDQGINTQYCVCSSSTFPILSITDPNAGESASCAYTDLPSDKTINPQPSLPVITSNCQVCSVGFDFQSCFSSVADCTPTPTDPPAAPTPDPTPPPG